MSRPKRTVASTPRGTAERDEVIAEVRVDVVSAVLRAPARQQ